MADLKQILGEHYRVSDAQMNGLQNSALHSVHRAAYASFEQQSFPTQRNEEWKYLNIQSLLSTDFRVEGSSDLQRSDVPDFVAELSAVQLVFLNGRFMSEWSTSDAGAAVVCNLRTATLDHALLVEQHLGRYLPVERNAFIAANSSCMSDGAFIYVPRTHKVEREICILNIIDAREADQMVQPRHLIVLEQNAECKVVMRTQTVGSHASFCNQSSEVVLNDSAQFDCVFVQDDSDASSIVNSMQIEQSAHSNARVVTASLSGRVLRNDLGTRLSESGAEAHMYGVYCVRGNTAVDNHTVMDHSAAHCHSNELYKGILDDRSQGVFNGKIYVRKDAQKTLAYQSNRNVILSESASVNTKPQLEILADDVKCSHGCTVGKMDEEALFYLRARGIGEQQARALLLTAFAEDVTTNISNEVLRDFINARIEAQLLASEN